VIGVKEVKVVNHYEITAEVILKVVKIGGSFVSDRG